MVGVGRRRSYFVVSPLRILRLTAGKGDFFLLVVVNSLVAP